MTSEHPQGERGTTPTGEHHSVHDWAHDRTITVRLTGERVELAPYRIAWLAKLVHSTPFEAIIAIVLVINAVALAILTLPNMPPAAILISINLNIAAYVIYVIELILRVVSYGKKPWMFFRRGWNVFDFVVVAAVPLLQEHTALLRLLRLPAGQLGGQRRFGRRVPHPHKPRLRCGPSRERSTVGGRLLRQQRGL